jgi:hypothetical protein
MCSVPIASCISGGRKRTPSVTVYLLMNGSIGISEDRDAEWREMIRRSEALLIYFCAPPYNSSGVKTLTEYKPTIVQNYKRRHRLPPIVSNMYETTPVADPNFKPYGW